MVHIRLDWKRWSRSVLQARQPNHRRRRKLRARRFRQVRLENRIGRYRTRKKQKLPCASCLEDVQAA
nr:hypothetical protein CFP56_01264 [Quercus suber]